jgi:hypothetical protein
MTPDGCPACAASGSIRSCRFPTTDTMNRSLFLYQTAFPAPPFHVIRDGRPGRSRTAKEMS